MNLFDFIIEKDNFLPPELCERIIEKFEQDDRCYRGVTAGGLTSTKKSLDLQLSQFEDWGDIDSEIYERFKPEVSEYLEFLNKSGYLVESHIRDSGYQIQKTTEGEGYGWHHDFASDLIKDQYFFNRVNSEKGFIRNRIFTYIFYLNTVEEGVGGRTQFEIGGKIKSVRPEQGKLLLFPAWIIFRHRGEELQKGVKYLSTGWVTEVTMGEALNRNGFEEIIESITRQIGR